MRFTDEDNARMAELLDGHVGYVPEADPDVSQDELDPDVDDLPGLLDLARNTPPGDPAFPRVVEDTLAVVRARLKDSPQDRDLLNAAATLEQLQHVDWSLQDDTLFGESVGQGGTIEP